MIGEVLKKKSVTILDATLTLISLSQKRAKIICIRKCVYILKILTIHLDLTGSWCVYLQEMNRKERRKHQDKQVSDHLTLLFLFVDQLSNLFHS